MSHYNSYDSFKIKRSIEKKQRAKEKAFRKRDEKFSNFIIDNSDDYGVVIDVRNHDAYVLYNGNIHLVKLRKDINMCCNKVLLPGDKVLLSCDMDNLIITNMIKRSSLLSRIKKDRTRIDDIGITKHIAANIDLAVIVVSAKEPPLHPKFIDRYLMILQYSNIPAIICLNKCDLKTEKEDRILEVYRDLGIPVIETSAYNHIGIEKFKSYLFGKQSIFVGNSGVGKSSLTNAIMNDHEIKTNSISEKTKKGRHTTTSSKYYEWAKDSSIIDTPGIRSLDVSSFSPIEVQDYFSELTNWKEQCKYDDCLHYNEPYESCSVKQAVSEGLINRERYESYLKIMRDILDDERSSEIYSEYRNF